MCAIVRGNVALQGYSVVGGYGDGMIGHDSIENHRAEIETSSAWGFLFHVKIGLATILPVKQLLFLCHRFK